MEMKGIEMFFGFFYCLRMGFSYSGFCGVYTIACLFIITGIFPSLQMKQSMEELRSLASRYGDLYQASFDADSATLRNVELYPKLVSLFLILGNILLNVE